MNHSFDIKQAATYGLVEAILISNFQFWIAKNRANQKSERDGRTWTYNSVRALQELFPYLTPDKITGALTRLVDKNILLAGNFNDKPGDRTKWYAFVNESEFVPDLNHLVKSQRPIGKIPNGLPGNPKCTNTTDSKPDGGRASRLPAEWVLPKAYGEWALSEFPTWTADHIRRVALMFKNHWIAAAGQQARKLDWQATWQNWCLKEPGPAGAKQGFGNVALPAWYESDAGITAKAHELGLTQAPGERIGDLRWRIEDILRDGVLGNAPTIPLPDLLAPPVAAVEPVSAVSEAARAAGRAAMRDALNSKVLPAQPVAT